MARLLLIEDDAETAGDVLDDLRGRGHEVVWAATGPGRRPRRPGTALWGAIILDRMLPGQDGLSVLQDLRRDGDRTPALVLSALGDVDERIRGLRAGGDDYLAKPFALGELAARIEALLRRPVDSRETVLRVGSLEIDLIAGTGRRGARDLDLLPRELKLLAYLMRSPRADRDPGDAVRGGLELPVHAEIEPDRRPCRPPAPEARSGRRGAPDPERARHSVFMLSPDA